MNHEYVQINENRNKNLYHLCHEYDDKQCDNKHKMNSSR